MCVCVCVCCATYPQIFSHLSTSILTSFFTVLPKGVTARSLRPSCTIPRGAQPMDPRHTWPVSSPPHPSKRWSLTSTVTPTPLLYSFFSFRPKSKTCYSWLHTTIIDHALAHAGSRRSVIMEEWVQFQGCPYNICGRQSSTGTESSPRNSGLPYRYHSTIVPYCFINLLRPAYNINSLQCLCVQHTH